MIQKTYLGDGLYAVWDGYQMQLRANDFTNPTDVVYLDEYVMQALIEFYESQLEKESE